MTLPEQLILAGGALALGIQLDQVQLSQFARFQELLQEWNQYLNLTALVDAESIQVKHFLDSLSCVSVTGDLSGQRLVDVGTGAGFPGIPLKILFPGLQLTLVESTAKKCRFLDVVTADLRLDDVVIVNDRVENIGRQRPHRQGYDWAVARAVAALVVLAEYLFPLVRVGGTILAQKGRKSVAEIADSRKAFDLLGGDIPLSIPVHLPGIDEVRYLVTARKVAQTPAQYPRRAGVPGKKPLLNL